MSPRNTRIYTEEKKSSLADVEPVNERVFISVPSRVLSWGFVSFRGLIPFLLFLRAAEPAPLPLPDALQDPLPVQALQLTGRMLQVQF